MNKLLLLLASWVKVANGSSLAMVSTDQFLVGVHAGPSGVSIANFSFWAAGGWTVNLPPPIRAIPEKQQGGTWTAISERSGAHHPVCKQGCEVKSNASHIQVSNMVVEDTCRKRVLVEKEDWTLEILNRTSFCWTIRRKFSEHVSQLEISRVGFTFETTLSKPSDDPVHGKQIPAYADMDMFYDKQSQGGFGTGNGYFEFLSEKSQQYVRFSPSGALFHLEGVSWTEAQVLSSATKEQAFFSFAKPAGDGTTACNIGFESVDRRETRHSVEPGSIQFFKITMTMVMDDVPGMAPAAASDPFPSIEFRAPQGGDLQKLEQSIRTITSVQYQLNGFIFGNNPASTPCLHEQAWWPLITGLFPAGSLASRAMQKQLGVIAACGWAPEPWARPLLPLLALYQRGHSCDLAHGRKYGMMQRWNAQGFYNCPWGPLQDQNVMFIVAVYRSVVATGDKEWLQSMLPALEAMRDYLASRGLELSEKGPVLFTSPASGRSGSHATSNWYDAINFGHHDAFLAVHGVWSLKCLAEIYAYLGDDQKAQETRQVFLAAKKDFNLVFWNSSAKMYHDWVDVDGNARSYWYVDIAFTAIIVGVADLDQATALIEHYATRLDDVCREQGITKADIWSPPSNLYPITDPGEYCVSKGQIKFPMYENGGSFFHSVGLQMAALGAMDRADDAHQVFQAFINSGFGRTRGWAQQLYWGKQPLLDGSDPLNTALLSVWGFLMASFAIEPTLKGLEFKGTPAKALEGAQFTFGHLGEDVCVKVKDGRARRCETEANSRGESPTPWQQET